MISVATLILGSYDTDTPPIGLRARSLIRNARRWAKYGRMLLNMCAAKDHRCTRPQVRAACVDRLYCVRLPTKGANVSGS
jgi:hypothetical protein